MESPVIDKTALVQVLGCKVNQAEAASMAVILEQGGYRIDQTFAEPDLVVIHTCCVTGKAEGKSRRMVNRMVQKYPSSRVLVTGCLAEMDPLRLKEISERVVVLGTFEKEHLPDLIQSDGINFEGIARRGSSACANFVDLGSPGLSGRARTFLKVQDGCSQRCTYCIVPAARGPSRSLPAQAVVDQARKLGTDGFAEIVLTGIHLGHYGRDFRPRTSLEALLGRLLDECPASRFRLSSIEPQEISPHIIELVAESPRLCRHFHIPVQSGDDGILKRMGRPYDTTMIHDLMRRISTRIPEACVGLDIMVGFPGEDELSFRKTENLIRTLAPAYLHVFPFSPRPGTLAASFKPKVAEKSKRLRVEELRSLSKVLRRRFYERFLGTMFSVAPESQPESPNGLIIARTDNYIPVRVRVPPALQDRPTFEVIIEKVESEEVWGTCQP